MNVSIKSFYSNMHLKVIFTDRLLMWSFFITCISLLLSTIFSLFMYQQLPPLIPLYNQMPWGETRLTTKPFLFLPIVITLCIFIMNTLFSSALYTKIPLLSRLFSVTTLLLSFLAFLFIIRTIQVVV